MSDDISIRHELRCGDLGHIVSSHGQAYEPLGGYGLRFEAYVAQTVAEFVLQDGANGRIWLAERSGILVGCFGYRALEYCRHKGCRSVILETTDELPESERMYEKLGFYVASNTIEELWDGSRQLIQMKLELT